MRLRIRTRLTLASAGLVAVVLAAAGIFVVVRFQADLMNAVDAGLRSRADALLADPEPPDPSALTPAGSFLEPEDAFVQVLATDGRLLGTTPGLSDGPVVGASAIADLRGARLVETTLRADGEIVPARVLAIPIDDGRILLVGASTDDQHEALGRLAVLLAIGGPLALVLVVAVVWVIVGAALTPVESMRTEAAAISASEPGRRLPVRASGDELARLGETLNAMLERLEEALERERRFVDDASHELRTPLANLKAELDLARSRARTAEELELALRSASEETDRLARLAEDLLVLARAEGGRLPVRREPVRIADVLRESAARFAAPAADRGVDIAVRVDGDVRADVDELRIRQAVGNLLDNALRHTPAGGRVTVEAGRDDGALRLRVRDTGEGFPPGSIPGVFEAFARPDTARTRGDGAGLGLAIVRAIAESHGGSVVAGNDADGGAAVTLSIPG